MLNLYNMNKEYIEISDVIKLIQEEYSDIFKRIIDCFYHDIDASNLYADYLYNSHSLLHKILGNEFPCDKIDNFLQDIFLITIKYGYYSDSCKIPEIYLNYKQVLYYNYIKIKIKELVELFSCNDLIVEKLCTYERKKYQNIFCGCDFDLTCFNEKKAKDLFENFLDYYLKTNNTNLYNEEIKLFN